MDEGNATSTKDVAGGGNGGTLTGMSDPSTATSGWQAIGKLGKAVAFDGADDYVLLGTGANLNFAGNMPFTISGWVKTSDSYGAIVSFSHSSDNPPVLDIMIGYDGAVDSADKLMALVRQTGGASFYARITGGTVNNNAWRFFTLTRNSGPLIELFLDGVSQGAASNTESGGPINTNMRALGSERRFVQDGFGTADQRYASGTIDDVRAYKRTLTQAEITTLYNLTSPVDATLALTAANNLTATSATVFTVTTNASNGYNLTAYETGLMAKGATTISNWTGTNAVPTEWSTNCTASSTQCGFGYRTDDADLSQFNTSTLFAGFVTSTPGDIVAKSTATTTNDATTLTYKMSVDNSKSPGVYSTTIRYILTPIF